MARILRMPEIVANSTEAIIQKWYLDEGIDFAAGATVLAIETEKAVVDVEEEISGVILKRLKFENDQVDVGTPIAILGDPGEKVADMSALLTSLGIAENVSVNTPVPVAAASQEVKTQPTESKIAAQSGSDRIFASPLARKLARELNLTIEQLSGTGPNGRITRSDVESAHSASKPSAAVPAKSKSSTQSFEEIANTPLRKATASRLTQSKQEIPHFYLKATANAEKILSLRADLNATGRAKVSLNDLILKLAARTLEKVPDVNVNWTADAIRKFHQIDISIAVAGPRGLVTPVLRDLASKSVFDIATEVVAFREKINTNTLKQNEIEGGSISISNLGMYGTEEFSAIINPPQAAILAVGAARKEAVVIDDRVEVVNVIHFVLSADHRCVDGALAAQWMQEFIKSVEAPIEILL